LKRTTSQEIVFKGIVEATGKVVSICNAGDESNNYLVVIIDAGNIAETIKEGDYVAINGICLTVREINVPLITLHIWPSTVIKTNIITLKAGDFVNLERNRAGQPAWSCGSYR